MERQGAAGPARGQTAGGAARPDALRPVHWRRQVAGAEMTAVPEVRRAVRELLRHHWAEEADSAASAELCATELVTNALVHTDRGAVVTATMGPAPGAALRVEVRDFTAAMPTPCDPTVDDGTHGRGLMLVQTLADSWGVSADGVGKVVWFELAAGPAERLVVDTAGPAAGGVGHADAPGPA
ncbi:hypothetical protein C6N75_28840 [Streptomyces solincola]|uniref:Histidine kinase/HSP90-like ATPase domain-containing protein n=1 Tax=Streptomyces solincola TaxID=2100817 RepID=A0A2S9PN21_9ACTN|nr:ATP-binding protein [Streptomyces solincola]PRH75839.1 hypothetical protein C6N75_28840 [Streptomyces solincola]